VKTRIPDCGNWTWLKADPETLLPWFRNGVVTGGTLVKQNPRRSVWTVTAANGKRYFAKMETLPLFHFRNNAAAESVAAETLEKAGVPCVHFVACGKLGRRTMLVSGAVENAVSAKEFWFGTCTKDPAKRQLFLQNMRDFLALLNEKNVRHPDFHAGNILVRQNDCSPVLVDPLGVSIADAADAAELAHICVDFLPDIRQDEAEFLIAPLGKDPAALVAQAKQALIDFIAHEWDRRKARILSGNSKFSRTVRRDGRVFEVASTEWFGDRDLPDDLETAYTAETFPAQEAEARFLAMFRARLEGRSFSPHYAVREFCGETQILYSPREK